MSPFMGSGGTLRFSSYRAFRTPPLAVMQRSL